MIDFYKNLKNIFFILFLVLSISIFLFIKMEETQSHSRQDESDSTANDSNPLEDEVISKPNLLY